MPVQGPQSPGFYLPQAEYLSLSPNTTIALQGRRRYTLTIPSTSVPGGSLGTLQGSLLLEGQWPHGAGIYIHDVWLSYLPGDNSGELAITGMTVGLSEIGTSPFIPTYPLGFPSSTVLTPTNTLVAVRDAEKLVTSDDMTFVTQGLLHTAATQLFLCTSTSLKNNDPTNPHAMQANAIIIYTRLDGLLE